MSKTELMDIGEHCSYCGQIDYLPFKCSCKGVFCLQHRQPEQHSCSALAREPKVIQREAIDISHLPSSRTLFPDRSGFKVELKTTDDHPVTIKKKMAAGESLAKLKKLFAKAPKTNATKRIVEAAKLKSNAKGDIRIPQSERVYVWVQVIDEKHDKDVRHPAFISRGWPLGRALDSVANVLKVRNVNNSTSDEMEKLFLYRQDGEDFKLMKTSDRCSTVRSESTMFLVRGVL